MTSKGPPGDKPDEHKPSATGKGVEIHLTEEDLGRKRVMLIKELLLPQLREQGIPLNQLVKDLLDSFIRQQVSFDDS